MIKLPLLQTERYAPTEYAYVDPTQIESIHETTRWGVMTHQQVCVVTLKSGQQYTTTKGSAEISEMVTITTTLLSPLANAEVLRLLPGDVLVVTTRDDKRLTDEQKDWIVQGWRRVLPPWVKVAVVQGVDVKVVRDGGPETKAERIKKAGGESWQAAAQ